MDGDEIVGCCGIYEIRDLDWYDKQEMEYELFNSCPVHNKAIYKRAVIEHTLHVDVGMIIFSDNNKSKTGKQLRKYILDNKLGRVIMSPIVTNPKHDSRIRMYTWIPQTRNLLSWYRRMKEKYKDQEHYE